VASVVAALDDLFFGKIETVLSNAYTTAEAVKSAELLVGAVLIPGANAPKLVTRKMVASMYPGAVIVDVAVDQGGCVETTRPTSHSDPVYFEEGVLHYCVTNMPGAMPRTSTIALTNATFPYVKKIAGLGLKGAIKDNRLLKEGVNTFDGYVTCAPVAESQNRPHTDLDQML